MSLYETLRRREYRNFVKQNKEPLNSFMQQYGVPEAFHEEINTLVFELVKKGCALEDVLAGRILQDPEPKSKRGYSRMLKAVFRTIGLGSSTPPYDLPRTGEGLARYVVEELKHEEDLYEEEAGLEQDLSTSTP